MTQSSRVVLAFLIIGLAVGVASLGARPARAANVSFELFGSVTNGWGLTSTSETNPGPPLRANVGDTVAITLHSTDGFTHQFLLDLNGNGRADPGEPLSAPFSSTTTITFTVTQAGTFSYLCAIHGGAMVGTFTVIGTTTPSSAAPTGGVSSPFLILGVVVAIAAVAGASILVLRSRH